MSCTVEEGLTMGDCTGRKVIRVEFCQHNVNVFTNVNSTTYVQIYWTILGFCRSICMYNVSEELRAPLPLPLYPSNGTCLLQSLQEEMTLSGAAIPCCVSERFTALCSLTVLGELV